MKATQIACINDRIAIGTLDQLSLFGIEKDANLDASYIHILGKSTSASYFYISLENVEELHQAHMCKQYRTCRIDIREHMGICQLLDDFLCERRLLDHEERFLLETNLNYIDGGIKIFREILKNSYDKEAIDNWERNRKIVRGYNPKSCGNVCPYYAKCMAHSAQKNIYGKLLHDRKVVIEKTDDYVDIGVAEQQLKKNLDDAFYSPRKDDITFIFKNGFEVWI